jgi:hypothetical protein
VWDRRYGGAVDVERAADLYAQGWTLRQVGAELGVRWSTVSQQLQSAGITMRSGGPPTRPASTQQILELHDQGLTLTEVAKQVDMTVSGVWGRYRRARPPKSPRLGRWQQALADALDQHLAIGVRGPLLIISAVFRPALSSPEPNRPTRTQYRAKLWIARRGHTARLCSSRPWPSVDRGGVCLVKMETDVLVTCIFGPLPTNALTAQSTAPRRNSSPMTRCCPRN